MLWCTDKNLMDQANENWRFNGYKCVVWQHDAMKPIKNLHNRAAFFVQALGREAGVVLPVAQKVGAAHLHGTSLLGVGVDLLNISVRVHWLYLYTLLDLVQLVAWARCCNQSNAQSILLMTRDKQQQIGNDNKESSHLLAEYISTNSCLTNHPHTFALSGTLFEVSLLDIQAPINALYDCFDWSENLDMGDCSLDALNQTHTVFEKFMKMSYQDINNGEFHAVIKWFKNILQPIMIHHTVFTDVNSKPVIWLLMEVCENIQCFIPESSWNAITDLQNEHL